jgi:glycosyltransferase involved in cell wall biosynthesis
VSYSTSLRAYTLKRLEEIGQADIIVGIPCFNNEKTIAHVIQMVTHGLDKYYRNKRNLIFIADGGSTDDTREMAKEFQIKPWQEKLISIYRGIGGKGSACDRFLKRPANSKFRPVPWLMPICAALLRTGSLTC